MYRRCHLFVMPAPLRNRSPDGRLVAAVLAGSWRRHPPAALDLTPAELARAAPLLRDTGAAALGWHRLERSPILRATPEATDLHHATRLLALEEVRNSRALEHVALLLNLAGMEPLLVKGWAVAQYYPAAHLRPYGDLDLCAPRVRHAEARSCLASAAMPGYGINEDDFFIDCGPGAKVCRVDLHRDFAKNAMPDTGALFERSIEARVGKARLRLLSAEDHLRFVILHFFRHGGVRPLWLCDIAAMVEAAPNDFDWAGCLTSDRRVAEWVGAGVSLASRLLNCDVERVPAFVLGTERQRWLDDVVLREWTRPNNVRWTGVTSSRRPRRLRDVAAWLRARWPNSIQAAILHGGSVRSGSHQLYPMLDVALRAAGRLGRLAAASRK
jgi:putative nucleotidyltransferase-like protein